MFFPLHSLDSSQAPVNKLKLFASRTVNLYHEAMCLSIFGINYQRILKAWVTFHTFERRLLDFYDDKPFLIILQVVRV